MKARLVWIVLGLVTATVLGLYVAMYASPIRTRAAILSAVLLADDRIEVSVGCGSGVSWEVDESPDRVVVDVRMFHLRGACAILTPIELAEPLGERPLIDGATGDEVEVGNR